MYEIVGVYKGKIEVIDEAEDLQEAIYLVNEYEVAYGNDWDISYREKKEK